MNMKYFKSVGISSYPIMLSLLGEIDDLPLLVVELKVEAGLVANPILDRGRGLSGQGPPHRGRLAQVICDLGEHLVVRLRIKFFAKVLKPSGLWSLTDTKCAPHSLGFRTRTGDSHRR